MDFGRKNGTSAPKSVATFAISSQSVDTITLVMCCASKLPYCPANQWLPSKQLNIFLWYACGSTSCRYHRNIVKKLHLFKPWIVDHQIERPPSIITFWPFI